MQNLREILRAVSEENYTDRLTWAITKDPSGKPGIQYSIKIYILTQIRPQF